MKPMLAAVSGYLRRHPEEAIRAIRGAIAMRVGLPLDALRWLAAQTNGAKAPRNVVIESVPPGLRLSADVNLMGNTVRAAGTVFVETVQINSKQFRVELRLVDVSMEMLNEAPDSPVATLLKSGALDLSKPGNLAAHMPRRPAMLVEAGDDRVVVDLVKHPRVEGNRVLRRALAWVTPVLTVRTIATQSDHLDVLLRSFPQGVREAVDTLRRLL